MISPTICSYPFAHQHIDPNGAIKYCCNSHPDSHSDSGGRLYNIRQDTMRAAWNSDAIRQLRLDLIAGQQPAACVGCWQRENDDHTQGSSMRLTAALRQIPIATIQHRIDQAAAQRGYVAENPHDLQIMTGNLCNLACKMCGPRYSNTWSKFFRRRGFATLEQVSFRQGGGGFSGPVDSAVYLTGDQDWPITNPLNTVLQDYYADIRHIFLTGGEPTLIAQNIDFLEELVSSGHSQHIELRFSTNLTNINRRLLAVLDQFERIGINMSLDGMGDIAYIQRTPSDWHQILGNTDFLMTWLNDYQQRSGRQANITVNTVVSALNIHHVLDLWLFLSDRYRHNFHMGFTPLTDPRDNWYIGQVPRAVIDQQLARLPAVLQEIDRNSPSQGLRGRLEDFEFHLRADIYPESYDNIRYLLNNLQALHPELDIAQIYSIYTADAV